MQNNTMLVTGASSGLGYELAKRHAESGGDLVLVARRRELLEKHREDFEREYQVKVHIIDQDLIAPGAKDRILSFLKDKAIEVDLFANNAGFGGTGAFLERLEQEDDKMIQLNILAATELLRAFAAQMRERGAGKILNVGSTAGYLPGGANQAVYCASKAYVNSLSRALSAELKGSGVSVTLLSPGATETEFAKVAGAQKLRIFKKAASADKVAKAGYEAMLKEKTEVIAGLPLSQRILLRLMPFLPQDLALSVIKKEQDPNA